jgi:hypothetical protein
MSKMSNLDLMRKEKKRKTHFRDVRLFNNAGMNFPTCRANEKMLDLEAAWLPISAEIHEVTCKHCLKAYHYNNPF